jgi:ABC-type uncharacterized transport system permease subunit
MYFLVGSAYRVSFLGAFTSPLAFLFQMIALLIPMNDTRSQIKGTLNPWLQAHAGISVVAYGAFALACVAGGMYFVQERQLKTRNIQSLFYQLPPLAGLASVIARLLLTGFALLTAGFVAGAMVGKPAYEIKVAGSLAVWLVYAGILLAERTHRLSPRRLALLAMAAFVFALTLFRALKFIAS